MVLSTLPAASWMRRVCDAGTASSAEFSIASSGTDTWGTQRSPCAFVWSTDHCDIHARSVGGLGIHLVREIANDVRYTREPGENVLEVRLNRKTEEA